MLSGKRTIAIIPARGGSKEIPRKNVRLLKGRPLISYVIEAAQKTDQIDKVIVSTDDQEIAEIARQVGVETISRPPELATDEVPLDPVIAHAINTFERVSGQSYEQVVTIQPTSPLLRSETLKSALAAFETSGADTLVSVRNRPHLAWTIENGRVVPAFSQRVNRQQLPPRMEETGAFLICKREFVTNTSRFGPAVTVFETPEDESIDLDTVSDWVVCEHRLRRKRIVLRADGNRELGLGHVLHCIALGYHMVGHQVLLVTRGDFAEGLRAIANSKLPYATINSDADFERVLEKFRPDIVVNDTLDTTLAYVAWLRNYASRVVTIEDLGPGSQAADVAVNALYDDHESTANVKAGSRYVCLREEFQIAQPAPFSEEVHRIVVIFGGTDPAGLAVKAVNALQDVLERHPDAAVRVIVGPGYRNGGADLEALANDRIQLVPQPALVSAEMRAAQLAITSQGRTVYELAALGIPAIVMAQNSREQKHRFAEMSNGFINLGLGQRVDAQTLASTVEWLVKTPHLRREMRELMLRNDLRSGIDRVAQLIVGE